MSEDPSTWLGLVAYAADTAIRQLSEILPSVLRPAPEDELPGPLEGVEDRLARRRAPWAGRLGSTGRGLDADPRTGDSRGWMPGWALTAPPRWRT
jgi:hypothetical protein